jgi:starch-binding outer membrane protein, SusD/RagB family
VYYSVLTSQLFHFSNLTFVNPELYNSYEAQDLRRTLFFRRPNATALGFVFRGSLSGDFVLFSGLSTGELYLILAETEVRLGRTASGLDYLNQLLEKRYKSGSYVPLSGLEQTQALNRVLLERRKELAFRGLRWNDLRRLNLEPNLATTLRRTVNGIEYVLSPKSPRYVFPIPQDELDLNGLEPNIR